jgi:anti-sigma factor RsiW
MIDPITEADIHAYIDHQLEAPRRIEVEDYLALNPALAAQAMADMRARHLLRLAFQAREDGLSPILLNAARRLERALGWRRVGLRIRSLAACVLLVGFGWFAHSHVGVFSVDDSHALPKLPSFVEDARRSHETSAIRLHMVSQSHTEDYDPADIRAEIGISLPNLPAGWRVIDTEIFPSSSGASVELVLDAMELGKVSLFASKPMATPGPVPLSTIRGPNSTTVYWEQGGLAFALTGSAAETALERAASQLGGISK